MTRSLKVKQACIKSVKQAVKRNGYMTQQVLAEELGMARSTLSLFLNGKPVSTLNFYEICQKLGLDHQEIADWEESEDIPDNTEENEEKMINPVFSQYIERPPLESTCLETVNQAGSLLRIKSAKGMGKTLLVDRILSQVALKQYKVVRLSFLSANKRILRDLEQLIYWFTFIVSKELGLTELFKANWESGLGIYSCTSYFEDYLLKTIDKPLILIVEEIDSLFPYQEIADDFLSVFRSWHEKAKTKIIWQKLRLVLTYSTESYIPANLNQSPLNVGTEIELPDFTPEQVIMLANQYNFQLEAEKLQTIMNLVGGHPSLVQKAIYALTKKTLSLAEFAETATTEAGIYGDHLRGHWINLQEHPLLAEGMKKVIQSSSPVDLGTIVNWQLHSLGLVRFEDNAVKLRYKLYADYFSYRLSSL